MAGHIPNLSILNPQAESLTHARVFRCAQAILAGLILFTGTCFQGMMGEVGSEGRGSGIDGGTWRIRQIARGPSEHDSTQTMLPRPLSVVRGACPSRASEEKGKRGAEAQRASGVQPGCRLPSRRRSAPAACSSRFPTPCKRHPLALASGVRHSPVRRDAVPAVLPAAHCAPARHRVAHTLVAGAINAT